MTTSSSKSLPRRSLRGKNTPTLSEAPGTAPLQPAPEVHSSTSQPHLPPPASSAPSGLSTRTNSQKRRKRSPSPTNSADGRNTPELQQDSPSRLGDLGFPVGPKTSRNRLVDLLDKYVKTKRPRLTREDKASRIRSAREVRPKPTAHDPETHVNEASPDGTQDVQAGAEHTDPVAPDDYDFNQLDLPDLIRIVEGIGLDGKTLPKDKLVALCNQNRDLIRIPRHMFRFALPKPQAGPSLILTAGPVSHHKHQDDGQPSLIHSSTHTTQGSTSTGQGQIFSAAGTTLPKETMKAKERAADNSVCQSESSISKQRTPYEPSERNPTEEPAESSEKRFTEKDVLQDTLPSLEQQPSLTQSSTRTTHGSAPTGPVQISTLAGPTLPKNPKKAKVRVAKKLVRQSESSIRKQRSKGKGRATSFSPCESSERSPTEEPPESSQKQSTEKDVLQDAFPSLEHRRFLYPRPNPTSKLLPTSDPEPADLSDDDWLPPDDDKSSSEASDGLPDSISDKHSPFRESTSKKPAFSRTSPPPSMKPQPQPASASPAPEVNEFVDHGQGPLEEDKDEPQWRFKYCESFGNFLDQLKHSLAETNRKLELVTKDLAILSQIVSRFADVKPTPSPETKVRGGRSASWMRLHIDTLLGHTEDSARLPAPATGEDQKAWKIDVDLDDFEPCQRSPAESPPTFDESLLGSDGPRHPKATAQQLIVMRTMMQFVGVSSFRPDFSKSPSSAENKWLWDLAFSIFIKLVECGEYPGVSLDAANQQQLKKLLNTRVRSLMKQYQQESWDERRKKQTASAGRRRARLCYVSSFLFNSLPIIHQTDASLKQTKKLRERIVLSQKPLWPLSAVIQAACSDDETDHEGCLDLDSDQTQTAVHIRKLIWRSSELTDTIIFLEEYKARVDASIPKPPKQENRRSSSSNGRPPRPRLRCPNASISDHPAPSGLPIDCYSQQYLETLTPFERSALGIERKPLLSTLIPIIKSL
ncbi:uncharacterized protein MELLADRAFT_61955 [Melampsora larici-populina 98AG31]|uniref:Uncharacterized protein n=1 Tax=Melampsora larici-populina (strain 98AG31 / pathotype 3-4-7) TaxID=747676 RepID=F4RHE5_MELLP|nr:uncharacterized protein MELLADRAFT_61955 [Melampsora larici-populina 98AG31]EGG08368.1 hypothetical protein MELLADRAFT_61955 [Melampsora larici-populina 98AG31]